MNLQAVGVNWLEKTNNAQVVDPVVDQAHQNQMPEMQLEQPSQSPKLPARLIQRRGSVACGSLFNVNNQIRETGWDYLRKVNSQPQNSHVVGQNHCKNNETAMAIEQDDGVTIDNVHHEMDNDIENSDTVTTCQRAGENENGVQEPPGNDDECVPEDFTKEVLKVCSQFNPFLRLPNPPFTLNGRKRSKSVDCISRPPSFPTILEVNENASDANKNAAKDPFISNAVSSIEPNIVSQNDTTFATAEDFAMEVDSIEGSNDEIKEDHQTVNAIVSKWVNRFNTYTL